MKEKKTLSCIEYISLSVDIRRKVKGLVELKGACISFEMMKWHLLVECGGLGVYIATPEVPKPIGKLKWNTNYPNTVNQL